MLQTTSSAAVKGKSIRTDLIVVSSPSLMAALALRIHRNYVEEYASVVYRQGSCVEGSFDAHFLEFVAFSFVWAESFERQAVFEVWPEPAYVSVYHDLFGYRLLL